MMLQPTSLKSRFNISGEFVVSSRYVSGPDGSVICRLCKRKTTFKDREEGALRAAKRAAAEATDALLKALAQETNRLQPASTVRWKHDPGCPNIGKS